MGGVFVLYEHLNINKNFKVFFIKFNVYIYLLVMTQIVGSF